ncbi:MAG: hypothetical protein IIA23_02190, partial [Chloroflexi bacterium]|nr:hypothetical protein [Chloroflexota bacterium]
MRAARFRPAGAVRITAGVFAAALSVLLLGNPSGVEADSTFDPVADVLYCNNLDPSFPDPSLAGDGPDCDVSPGEDLGQGNISDVTFEITIPDGDVNAAPPFLVNFIPNGVTINETDDGGADGLGADIPVGETVGGVENAMTFGSFNAPCVAGFDVPFILYNVALPDNSGDPRASTNIVYPRNQGQLDRFGAWNVGSPPPDFAPDNVADANVDFRADSATLAVHNYPSYLLDVFDPDGAVVGNDNIDGGSNLPPVVPIAVYGGMTIPVGASFDWLPLFVVQFGAGDLAAAFSAPHPFANFTADLGQPSITVFQDPTATEASVSSINDICTPMTMRAMFLGTTAGGETRARNPFSYTNFHLNWTMSYRDLDQDGRENSYDACPHTPSPNNGSGSAVSVSGSHFTDDDNDRLHFACDPDDGTNENAGDIDDDGFVNGLDNCPQVANGLVGGNSTPTTQKQTESTTPYATAAPDSGPLSDSMGDVCEGTGAGEYGVVNITQNGAATTITTADDVANGRFHADGNVVAKCFGSGTDLDGDGYCKEDQDAGQDDPAGACGANCVFRH